MNFNFFGDDIFDFKDYLDFKYYLMKMILIAVFYVIGTEFILSIFLYNKSFSDLLLLRLASISFYILLMVFMKKDYKRLSVLSKILFLFLILESIYFSMNSYGDYFVVWLIASQLVYGAFSIHNKLYKYLTAYYFALYLGITIYSNSLDLYLHRLIYLSFILVINYYMYLGIEKFLSQHEVINNMDQAIEELKSSSSKSLKDDLTNTYNRKSLYSILKREISLVKQNNTISSLVFLDLDNFKSINDKFGHQKGDLILKKLSSIFFNVIRDEDYICRFGGDEFIFILSNCEKEYAVEIINRIKEKIENKLIYSDIKIDFSYGVKEITSKNNLNAKNIIEDADNAMYRDKNKKIIDN